MGCFSSKTIEGENEIAKDVVLYERTATSFNQPRTSVAERVKRNRDLEKSKKKKPKFGPKITVKYDIKAQIGESGKYTKVFRVENKYTKQPFALKLLIKPEGQAAMECEKVILNRIKHKNIVRLSEVIMSDKKRICALVLELITGGNLFERIHEKGMFSERAAVKVLVQMLDGIQYLHGIGITHRGLTLHNVLFYHQGKDSRVVLTDFATAHTRRSADDTLMRGPCGSREYFAPEVVLERQYTQSVDVWAVGVITYAMLAAEFPFPSRDKQAMLLAISRAEYSMDSE
ncbi:Protein kinase domain, partial [Trinorchestia longiramus]